MHSNCGEQGRSIPCRNKPKRRVPKRNRKHEKTGQAVAMKAESIAPRTRIQRTTTGRGGGKHNATSGERRAQDAEHTLNGPPVAPVQNAEKSSFIIQHRPDCTRGVRL